MLETVKHDIINSPCISFREYFTRYVFQVQDENIDSEVTFLLRNNSIDINLFNRVMNKEIEENA